MDGALLLDKPVGPTSNAVLQRAKRLLGARKAGHAGTLDPLASGLLVLLFGEATKFAGPLLDADKEYVATLKLGERTATGDAEGEVLERGATEVAPEAVARALQGFVGETEQVPPMHSALKRDGVPLYRLAREGAQVERKARKVRISLLEARRFVPPYLEIRVRCSKGTYVRVLGEDIGRALGTVAHLAALRRTGSGALDVRDAVTLDALEEASPHGRRARVMPLPRLLAGLPRAHLDGAAAARFRNGQALPVSGLAPGLCAVYGLDGEVIGLAKADAGGLLRPMRLVATQAAE